MTDIPKRISKLQKIAITMKGYKTFFTNYLYLTDQLKNPHTFLFTYLFVCLYFLFNLLG